MSGFWMMVSKHGPNPEDMVITTHVEGLERERRRAIGYLAASVGLIVFDSALIISMLWGRANWIFIVANTFVMVMVSLAAIISGMFVGRYVTFRELLKVGAKVTEIPIDKEPDEE